MSWPKVRLGEVCEVRAGRDYKDVQSDDGAYPIYGTGGIMGMATEARCPANSVIVGRKGTLDNPMLIREPFWNIDTCFGVIPSDKLDAEYLLRFCQKFDFYSLVPASGRPSTTSDAIKGIQLPLPDLDEQRKIAASVDRAMKRVDAIERQFEKLRKASSACFKAELKATFDSVAWDERLSEQCEVITDGDHLPPPKTTSGIPFLVISDVAAGRLNFENTRFVPRVYFEKIQESRKPRRGDVLLTVTGSYGIPVEVDVDREFCFQRHIALVRSTKFLPRFLVYMFLSPKSKRYFERVATGAAQKTVSLSSLRSMNAIRVNVYRKGCVGNRVGNVGNVGNADKREDTGTDTNDTNRDTNHDTNETNAIAGRIRTAMLRNPMVSMPSLSAECGVSRPTIARTIKSLKERGAIRREGGTRGKWVVLKP